MLMLYLRKEIREISSNFDINDSHLCSLKTQMQKQRKPLIVITLGQTKIDMITIPYDCYLVLSSKWDV
jgi:hypothetical protein